MNSSLYIKNMNIFVPVCRGRKKSPSLCLGREWPPLFITGMNDLLSHGKPGSLGAVNGSDSFFSSPFIYTFLLNIASLS